jgi:hypothetical protein
MRLKFSPYESVPSPSWTLHWDVVSGWLLSSLIGFFRDVAVSGDVEGH